MTRKTDKTKREFMDAAHMLFLKKGYDNVNVQSICKQAGKAKGLFFYHFDKKENIVKLLLEEQLTTMAKALKKLLDDMDASEIEKMDFLMNTIVSKDGPGPEALRYFKKGGLPLWIDLYAQAFRDKYIFPIILSLVESGIEKGDFKYCSRESTEIIYLGISQFIHKNFCTFGDEESYIRGVGAISRTLETALGVPVGSIDIK